MEFMRTITERLEEIHQALDAIQAAAFTAADNYPELSDFYDEISDLADEMEELAISADSVAAIDLEDYM